jgi:hypothetical protein
VGVWKFIVAKVANNPCKLVLPAHNNRGGIALKKL